MNTSAPDTGSKKKTEATRFFAGLVLLFLSLIGIQLFYNWLHQPQPQRLVGLDLHVKINPSVFETMHPDCVVVIRNPIHEGALWRGTVGELLERIRQDSVKTARAQRAIDSLVDNMDAWQSKMKRWEERAGVFARDSTSFHQEP